MPEEMKIGELKKSDWYNPTIDVFSLSASFLKKLVKLLEKKESIDLGFLYIVEAMLDYNRCYHVEEGGVFCDNREIFWEKSSETVEEIKDYLEVKNKNTCTRSDRFKNLFEYDELRTFECF